MHRFIVFLRDHAAALTAAGLLAALFGALCLFLAVPLSPLPDAETVLWTSDAPEDAAAPVEGWDIYTFEDGHQKMLAYAGWGSFRGPAQEGAVVYADHLLTDGFEDALIELNCEYPLVLFLDGEIIYAGSSHQGSTIGTLELPVAPTQNVLPLRVSLPDSYSGKILTAAWAPLLEENGTFFFGPVTLYSSAGFFSDLSSGSMQSAFGAASMTILAFALAAMYINGLYQKQPDSGALYLCLFCCTLVLDMYLSNWEVSVYFEGPLQNWQLFRDISVTLLLLFMASHLKRFRTAATCAAAAQGALVVTAGVCSSFGIDNGLLGVLTPAAAYAALAFCLVCGMVEARSGNSYFRLFLIALAVAAGILAGIALVSALRGSPFAANLWVQLEVVWLDGISASSYFLYLLQWLLIGPAFLCVLVSFVREYAARRYERKLLEQHLALAERTGGEIQQRARQTAMYRHDIRRHLSVIDQFLQMADYDGARSYLQNMDASFGELPRTIYSGHALTDILLNAKLSEAEEKGLKVSAEVGHVPAALPLTDGETTSVVLNILDNAIRAAAASPEQDLNIRLYVKGNYLCFQCSNSVAAQASEQRGPDHGHGLNIVEQIVERHEGLYDSSASPGHYQVLIAVPVRMDPGLSDG